MITTQQFKQLLAQSANVSEQEASAFVDALLQTLLTHIKQGEEVSIQGLGTFRVLDSQQGELRRVAFVCDEKLREAVNAPFSFFEPMVIERPREEEPVENPVSTSLPGEKAEDDKREEIDTAEAVPEEVKLAEPETDEPMPAPVTEVEKEEVAAEVAPTIEPAPSTAQEPVVVGPSAKTGLQLLDKVNIGLAVCVFVLLWYLLGGSPSAKQPTILPDPVPVQPIVPDTIEAVAADTIQSSSADSITLLPADTQKVSVDTVNAKIAAPAPVSQPEKPTEKVVEPEPRPEKPTTDMLLLENGAPKMVVLEDGERLTLIADRIYGEKSFWCYIFDVNAYRLTDPDNVPKGVPLYLPNPTYFNIDANDAAAVRKARNHGAKLLKPKQK